MRGTQNAKAFRLYLQGENLFSVVLKDDMKRSRGKFRQATELDPEFARAWGWRSYVHVRSILLEWLPESAMADAKEWASTAVKLDPLDYATHWDLGFYHLNNRDFGKAKKCYAKGVDLYDKKTDRLDRKPGILAEAAEGFLHAGDPATAISLLERAMRIPDWYRWNLGWAYYQAQRYDEALAMLSSMRSKPGDRAYVPETQLFLAAAYYRKSMSFGAEGDATPARMHLGQALDEIHRFRAQYPDFQLNDAVAHRSRFQHKSDEDHWAEPLRVLWDQ
jgi:tetratricopeptide (TPR) repeat protein